MYICKSKTVNINKKKLKNTKKRTENESQNAQQEMAVSVWRACVYQNILKRAALNWFSLLILYK